MKKPQTIQELEKFLLQDSETKDLVAAGDIQSKSPDTKLTKKQVQHEVSVFSRVLINVYCGWPFHDEMLKHNILKMLFSIYENAHDMTSLELFEQLKSVIQIIPDNHINLRMVGYDIACRTGLRKKRPNVGSNIAGDKNFIVDSKKDIGVIGIRTLSGWSKEDEKIFEQQWRKMLPKVKILIIDLRDNSGGGSLPIDTLCRYIIGTKYPIARKTYIRNNTDANAVKNFYKPLNTASFDPKSTKDPDIYTDAGNDISQIFDATKAGFYGPIYVLTNVVVMSAAEIVCTAMHYHPKAKFIGTNTCGGEVYGNNYAHILLPYTHMNFNVGCVYREMFVENFELNGYEPDIKCANGTDAMDVALADIERIKAEQILKSINNKKEKI